MADDVEVGLYRKYNVERLNDPTGKHVDCRYYVLDLVHDKHSAAALLAYAKACSDEYPQLAEDLQHELDLMAVRRIGVAIELTEANGG